MEARSQENKLGAAPKGPDDIAHRAAAASERAQALLKGYEERTGAIRERIFNLRKDAIIGAAQGRIGEAEASAAELEKLVVRMEAEKAKYIAEAEAELTKLAEQNETKDAPPKPHTLSAAATPPEKESYTERLTPYIEEKQNQVVLEREAWERKHAAEKKDDTNPPAPPAPPSPPSSPSTDDPHDSISDEEIAKWTSPAQKEAPSSVPAERGLDEKGVGAFGKELEAATTELNATNKNPEAEWSAAVKQFEKHKQEGSISPEYYLKAVRESVAERSIEIAKKTPANLAGYIGKAAGWYKERKWYEKVAIGAALSGVTIATAATLGPSAALAAALAARVPAFLGGYVLSDAILERQNKIENTPLKRILGGAAWAIAMGAVGKYLVGPYIHEWLGNSGTPTTSSVPGAAVPAAPEVAPTPEVPASPEASVAPTAPIHPEAPVVPGVPAHAGLFSEQITVTDADSKKGLWGILEHKLTEKGTLTRSTPTMQRNILLDSLEKKLRLLDPTKLQELGFRPDQHGRVFIDVIRPGEKLDLSILNADVPGLPAHADVPLPPVKPSIPVAPDAPAAITAPSTIAAPAQPEVASAAPTPVRVISPDISAPAIPWNTSVEVGGGSIFIPEPSVYKNMMAMKAADIITLKPNMQPSNITTGQLDAVQKFLTQWKEVFHTDYGNRALEDIYTDTRRKVGELLAKSPSLKN